MRSYCCATMSWALATNSELMRHEPHPRAVSAEAFSGASGIDLLPDGRNGAGLYAIERASRIRRNGHHLAILRAQEALLGLSIPESILLRAGAVIR